MTAAEMLMVVGTLIVEMTMIVHERDDLESGVMKGVSKHLK